MFRQSDVRCVMAGFGFVKTPVEVDELLIVHVVTKKDKAFTAASFNEAGDEKSIDGFVRFLPDSQLFHFAAIRPWLDPPEPNVAALEKLQNHVKVFEFLVDDLSHLDAEFFVLHVIEHQPHRDACGLLFAMSVIDENHGEVLVDLFEPAF